MDKDGEVTIYEYNELNQLVRAGDIEYTWDNAGNLVSQTTTSGVIVATYTYDSYNRMVTTSVNSNNGTLEQSYTYDYLGNRTSKTTDGVTTYYVTDLSSGYSQVLKATTGSDVIYYTRGFELISRREGTTASYYLYDGGMSVRGLTDESGALTDTYVFDAFGNEVARTGTTENSYGYRGEEQDETGLYYLRARYMDPSMGTFTTMDTYQGTFDDPMSLHKYLFASSNPIKNCDPSGHMDLAIEEVKLAIIDVMAAVIRESDALLCLVAAGILAVAVEAAGSTSTRFASIHGLLNITTTLGKGIGIRILLGTAEEIAKAISKVIAVACVGQLAMRCYQVYLLHTKKDKDNVQYVGRTKNYWKYRYAYHKETKPNCDVDNPIIIPCLTYEESRSIEQTLMAAFCVRRWLGEDGLNRINGIASKNHKYDWVFPSFMAIDYVENNLEEEYLMMKELSETPWY